MGDDRPASPSTEATHVQDDATVAPAPVQTPATQSFEPAPVPAPIETARVDLVARPAHAPNPRKWKSPTTALVLSTAPIAAGIAVLFVADGFGLGGGDSWILGTTQQTNDARWVAAANVTGAVALAVIVAAPSFGHIYTDDVWNFGFKVRLAGAGVLAGTAAAFAIIGDGDESNIGSVMVLGGLGVVGAAALGVGSIYEIATAHRSARRQNARSTALITLTPTRNGLAITAAF